MEINVNTSGLVVFLKTMAVNSKKMIDSLVDTYNGIFQLNPEDARDIYMKMGDEKRKKGD